MIRQLELEELAGDDPWWRLYEEAFQRAEREPEAVILESLRRGVGIALAAREEGQTRGLAALHLLHSPPAVFLVYLAVHPDYRERGLGTALFEAAWTGGSARLREQGRVPVGMVWELAIPGDDASPQETAEYHRLLAFYGRRGGTILPCPYVQPPVDGVTTVPMRLMIRPAPGVATPGFAGSRDLARAIYREKYEAINGIRCERDITSMPQAAESGRFDPTGEGPLLS